MNGNEDGAVDGVVDSIVYINVKINEDNAMNINKDFFI